MGLPLLAIVVLVLLFRWDWLIPIVEAQATARLGRPVTIEHLHVKLGKVTSITAEGLRIGNPDGFEDAPPFAAIPRASLDFDVAGWLRDRSVAIPVVTLDQPVFEVIGRADGKDNTPSISAARARRWPRRRRRGRRLARCGSPVARPMSRSPS
ncbi:hypothetical protein ACFQY5_31665 [Paeniroseomonas aquatica]|uniref:hypothetical protein n=1 Tax=Paeniroseomonas aquatica TaxID=373043 RepID=UPI00360DB847